MDIADLEARLKRDGYQHFTIGLCADGRHQVAYRVSASDGYSVGIDADLTTAIEKAFVGYDEKPTSKPKVTHARSHATTQRKRDAEDLI